MIRRCAQAAALGVIGLALVACSAQPSDLELPGSLRWVRNFPGTRASLLRAGIGPDDTITLAFLNEGPVTLCDQTFGVSPGNSLLLLRLSSAATCPLLWAKSFAGDWQEVGAMGGLDEPRMGFAIDAAGDVFISISDLVGRFALDGVEFDFSSSQPGNIVAKTRGSDGGVLWARTLEDPAGGRVDVRGVAAAASRLYVAATVTSDTSRAWWVRLDGTTGADGWATSVGVIGLDGGAGAGELAARGADLLVAGRFVGELDLGTGPTDCTVPTEPLLDTIAPARFFAMLDTATGEIRWIGSLDARSPEGLQVAFDNDGESIVAGNFSPMDGWRNLGDGFDEVSGEERSYAEAMTVVRFSGRGPASADPDSGKEDRLTPCIDVDWAQTWVNFGQLRGSGLTVDRRDSILVAGSFLGEWEFASRPLVAQVPALFVAKVETTGREVWARYTSNTGPVTASDVASTTAGRVLGVGAFSTDETPKGTDVASTDDPPRPAEVFMIMLEP